MFSLLSGFLKWLFTKPSMRFLVLGLDNAGKTTTLEKLKAASGQRALRPEMIMPTVGLNLARIESNGVIAYFWDLGGQVALRSLWSKYYDEAHGILFIIDLSDQDRLDQAVEVLTSTLTHKTFLQRDVPVMVLLNKVDLLRPSDRSARCRQVHNELCDLNKRLALESETATVVRKEESPKKCSRRPIRTGDEIETADMETEPETIISQSRCGEDKLREPGLAVPESCVPKRPHVCCVMAGSVLESSVELGKFVCSRLIVETKRLERERAAAQPAFIALWRFSEDASHEQQALVLPSPPESPVFRQAVDASLT